MKPSLLHKLELLVERHEEVSALLSDAETISNQERFRELSREYSELEEVVATFKKYQTAQDDMEAAQLMLSDDDPDMREMAEEEIAAAKESIETLEVELQRLLLPKDPKDSANVFLEIRAGTGGDEAAIFSGICLGCTRVTPSA